MTSEDQYRERDGILDGEWLSELLERDARRYNRAFSEEEEARLS